METGNQTGYVLPDALEFHKAWLGCETRSYVPTPNQAFVIGAVEKALAQGLYYSSEVREFCAKLLGLELEEIERNFKGTKVEGGIFGMECYYARSYLRAKDSFAAMDRAHEALQPKVGMVLGTIMFNDYKRKTQSEVIEVNGLEVRVRSKMGKNVVVSITDALCIGYAIDRAVERGLRKMTKEQFIASQAGQLKTSRTPANQLALNG